MWTQAAQAAMRFAPLLSVATLQSFGFVFGFDFVFGCRFGFVFDFDFVSSCDSIAWTMRALVGVVHSARADVNTEQSERASESERERIEQLANVFFTVFIFFLVDQLQTVLSESWRAKWNSNRRPDDHWLHLTIRLPQEAEEEVEEWHKWFLKKRSPHINFAGSPNKRVSI